MLMYLAESYKQYVEDHKLDLYGTRPVSIPKPEMYVVYTGPKQDVPDVLHLSDLYGGKGGVDLEVTVCRGTGKGEISMSVSVKSRMRSASSMDGTRRRWLRYCGNARKKTS